MDDIALAVSLLSQFIPQNTQILIEPNTYEVGNRYIVRLTYTSPRSGRTMCMVAKGDNLPTQNDYLLHYYLKQIVLTPTEAAREFSRVYFLERRARQEAFLYGGQSGTENIRVTDTGFEKDKLAFKEYS